MKNYLLLLLLLASAIQTAFCQQISNASFENWQTFQGYQVPDSFYTFDQVLFLGVATTERTTDAHTGQFAALLRTIAGLATTNFAGLLSYGSFQTIGITNYFLGWPFSSRPTKMNFWYKFERAGNDSALARVILSKWDGGYSTIVGTGRLYISSNTPIYTVAEVPISYSSSANPDTIHFSFISSFNESSSAGTLFYVDDISLDSGPAGIDDHNQSSICFVLDQNYPNPFNPSTTISYSLPTTDMVQLKIFNILGQEVTTLVNEEKPSGSYELNWDAVNLPSGVYIYRLQAGSFVQTRKMILMK